MPASRRRRFTLHVVRFTRPPAGPEAGVPRELTAAEPPAWYWRRQAAKARDANKLFFGMDFRKYAEKMYLTCSVEKLFEK